MSFLKRILGVKSSTNTCLINVKLSLYKNVKPYYHVENYALFINNKRNRSLLTRLRAGCQDIEIEVGRWRGIPRDQRVCKLCNDGIETEMHFLLYCTNLYHIRISFNRLFTDLYNCNSDTERFILMFTKEFIRETARFIRHIYDERKKILYKQWL